MVRFTFIFYAIQYTVSLVQDELQLLDHGREIPKSQGRGWRFNFRLWNLLSTWLKTCQVANYLQRFGAGLLAIYLRIIIKILKINYMGSWWELPLEKLPNILGVSFHVDCSPLDSRIKWVKGVRMYLTASHHPTTFWWSPTMWRAMDMNCRTSMLLHSNFRSYIWSKG